MLIVVLFTTLLAAPTASIVCPPNACDDVQQLPLNCLGGILEKSTWCGCTDTCAKVEGESCSLSIFLGMPNLERCDKGLVCQQVKTEGAISIAGVCVKESDAQDTPLNTISKRNALATPCDTACRKKSQNCNFSFVIYKGQWFAKCDSEGNFLAEQCDNTNHCFCVDKTTGTVQESTKVLGSANCA